MQLQMAAESARHKMQAAAAQRKEKADVCAKEDILPVGTKVYIRDNSIKGRNKIQDAWAPCHAKHGSPQQQPNDPHGGAPERPVGNEQR